MALHRRRPVLFVSASIGVTAFVATAGCGDVSGTEVAHDTVERVAITEVRIESGSGDVTIRRGDAGQATIEQKVRYNGKEPGKTYRIDGTVLVVSTGCGVRCGVTSTIQAPPGVRVSGENGAGNVSATDVGGFDVRVGSGDLRVSGSSGAVTARASSGDITVDNVHSELRLTTGSGSIKGHGLGGAPIAARAGAGDIGLTLDEIGSVSAETSSGDINLTVPDGGYHIATSSSADDTTIGIRDQPDSANLLTVSSHSGDVKIQHS